ncbi:MAG TPA: type II secretion system protein GspJ [Geobacteraceae bacterium]|nr:type II secretion system protein GspJ [Geobacteraceae bacterium]
MSATLPKPDRFCERGFTLLELLLALTLLVILTAALYGSYFSLFKGRDAASEGMEARRELRTTLDLLRRELTGVIYRKNDKRFRFVVEDRDLYGKPASTLSFTAIAPPEAGQSAVSDMIDTSYRIVENAGKMVLTRQAKDLHFTTEPLRYPQMENVEGFLVECLTGEKWVRSWDTAINLTLPVSVRVTITVREDDKPAEYSVVATPRIPVQ